MKVNYLIGLFLIKILNITHKWLLYTDNNLAVVNETLTLLLNMMDNSNNKILSSKAELYGNKPFLIHFEGRLKEKL